MKVTIILALLFACTLIACTSPQNRENVKTPSTKMAKQESTLEKPHIYSDTFEFHSYNDDSDYMLLSAIKNQQLMGFVNDRNPDRNLLRGDICVIEWIQDTIYIAGDGERPEIADWLLTVKKIKDGNLSSFRKNYKKKIKYHYSNEQLSKGHLDFLYLQVEYYLANTKNELLQLAISKREKISYSIEEKMVDDQLYDVMGIQTLHNGAFFPVQWIYLNRETMQLFELDLPSEELFEFK